MDRHLHTATFLTRLLDEQFSLFGLKFGLDPVLGLVPGLGDIVSLGVSFYIVWVAKQYHLPFEKLMVMIRNIFADFFIGLLPVIGDISDVFYKANKKNLKIIYEHTGKIIDADVI